MDLAIRGRSAIVCAASKGLGRACAMSLARNGVDLVINSRGGEALETTARAIRTETGVEVVTVAADITGETGRAALLDACPEPDILVTNCGGPAPGDFRDWSEQDWIAALRANMLAPIDLIRAVVDGMAARGFGRIVNITSAAVRAPIADLGLSNGARAGLTGFVAGLARSPVAARGVTINNLLPERFLTDRLRGNIRNRVEKLGLSEDEVINELQSAIPARRFGDPDEFGDLCAFLCSARAGFITGQNILIDGGKFHATL